jgi:23S rRNA (uracil1939-C5)-methyltransferase
VFVEGALPGETVLAEVGEVGRVLRGSIIEITKVSAARRPPACPHSAQCGGCDWLHVDEKVQREEKAEIVVSALEHLGGVARGQFRLLPAVRAGADMGYRRRATLHRAGRALGFFGKRSHDRVEVAECPALTDQLRKLPGELAPALLTVARDLEEVRLLEEGGKTAVSLHLNGGIRDRHREVAEGLLKKGFRGVVLVPDKGARESFGKPALLEAAGTRVRPDSFAQANAAVNAKLVEAGVAAAGKGDVLELYCGNGNFTLALAAVATSVVAVESDAISLELAREAAREKKLGNVRFVLGDSKKVAEGLGKEGQKFVTLLVDPPRSGAPGVAQWARGVEAKRVVYLACDPGALARDAGELMGKGFRPQTLQVFDLFPQTRHIEALMVFESGAAP